MESDEYDDSIHLHFSCWTYFFFTSPVSKIVMAETTFTPWLNLRQMKNKELDRPRRPNRAGHKAGTLVAESFRAGIDRRIRISLRLVDRALFRIRHGQRSENGSPPNDRSTVNFCRGTWAPQNR